MWGVAVNERKAIFISHASPEGNAFTIWLGAKLSALGYEVWADVLRLSGGEDWQRKLESAIRERACKVLLVADALSVAKQGVRNEIQIATDVARKIGDTAFIIPLRLGAFDAPFLIAHAQYINFEPSWAQGLEELLKVLGERYKVPRSGDGNPRKWLDLQLLHGKAPIEKSEPLISNWLEIRRIPPSISYYPLESPQAAVNTLGPYPKVKFGDGYLSCETLDLKRGHNWPMPTFLNAGWPALGVQGYEARRLFTDLANQALGLLFKMKGLNSYEMSNRQATWWVGKGAPNGRVGFRWANLTGSRQLQGTSVKRGIQWHFGVSTTFRSSPFGHVRVKGRLLFTEDGQNPLKSSARMHRLRRSFAKGWRNARWRDMSLAFLYWVGDGVSVLNIPMGTDEDMVVALPPITFVSPVSIPETVSSGEDLDDPDIEFMNGEDPSDELSA